MSRLFSQPSFVKKLLTISRPRELLAACPDLWHFANAHVGAHGDRHTVIALGARHGEGGILLIFAPALMGQHHSGF